MDCGSTELLMDGGGGRALLPPGANWPGELQPRAGRSTGRVENPDRCLCQGHTRCSRGCLSNPPGSSLTCPLCPDTGPVTNAFIVLAPANMFNPDGKPSVPLPKFSRHLHGTESSDEPGTEGVTLRLGLHQQVLGASGRLGRGDRHPRGVVPEQSFSSSW